MPSLLLAVAVVFVCRVPASVVTDVVDWLSTDAGAAAEPMACSESYEQAVRVGQPECSPS